MNDATASASASAKAMVSTNSVNLSGSWSLPATGDCTRQIPKISTSCRIKSEPCGLLARSSKGFKNTERRYKCKLCRTWFPERHKYKLYRHMQTHKENPRLACVMCKKLCSQYTALELHLRSHTREKPFSCKYCEKCFPDSNNRLEHERIHTNERPYKCQQCSRGFISQRKLNGHMGTHLTVKPYKCQYWDARFAYKVSCKRHEERYHESTRPGEGPVKIYFTPVQCSICGKWLSRKDNLKTHMRQVHISEGLSFKCNICVEGFPTRRHLQRHEESHRRKNLKRAKKKRRPRSWKNSLVAHKAIVYPAELPSSWDLDAVSEPKIEICDTVFVKQEVS